MDWSLTISQYLMVFEIVIPDDDITGFNEPNILTKGLELLIFIQFSSLGLSEMVIECFFLQECLIDFTISI